MKRLIIILSMGLIVGLSFAGIDEYYTFNATSGTYTTIVGTNANISADEALSEDIPIGFTFPYGEYIYNEVKISSNGWIGLGTSQTSSNPYNTLSSTTIVPVLAPLWDGFSLASGSCEYLLSGTAPNRIFTIQYTNLKLIYDATTMFNLQARLYENGKIDFVYGFSIGGSYSPSASIGINMLPGGSGWFYSIYIIQGVTVLASTTFENPCLSWPGEGTIFEFNPVLVPNDLAALSITGPTATNAEQSYDYVITVRNRGSNPQTTYQVKLLLGTQEIGSVNGTPIQAGEIITFTIPWIPSTAGPATLYGKVVLASDENTTNDQTPPLNIAVQPAGVQWVTIGAGNELARVPMDFNWQSSLFECLFYPDELGFISGTITALAFYNNFVTNLPDKPTKIWLGTTNQADLSAGWIPSTQLTLVFDGYITYPAGENTITIHLQTPYMHTPGNLVMMVQRPLDAQYYSSSDNFLAQTIGTNRARMVKSIMTDFDPANPPFTGTVSGQFPKTTIFYSDQELINDLSCLNISGNPMPTVGNNYIYIINIRNNGTTTQDNYTVKLMREGGQELNSVQGPTIGSYQTLVVTIPWTPTTPGPTYLYGEVFLTVDQITFNNQSSHLNIEVLPAGVQGMTIGEGNQSAQVPMDFYFKNSLFECLFYPDELGFSSGTITALAFYNNFVSNLLYKPTKIWLGTTNQADLSAGWIPSTQLTLVFDGNITYPSGENTITIHLQTPYMHTPGNLVMMVQRPMDTQYYSYSDNFQAQTVGTSRARKLESDTTAYDPANPPASAYISGRFPKTTIFYSGQAIVDDLACLSISGNTAPNVGTATPYTVTIKNNGTAVQSDYIVKLMKEDGVLLGSVPGTTINSFQTLDLVINWTPTETGATYIYAEVEMTGDEITNNNQTSHMNVNVFPASTVSTTVGTGNTTGHMPMDFYWKNSLFETIYLASELNIGGLLTDIQFYNYFGTNLPNKPTNIWVGETTQTDLSAGWIPSTQLTQVFSGNVDYPSGLNDILIHLTTPYPYDGRNLVVMVERPMDINYWDYSIDVFRTQIGTVSNRTRITYGNSIDFDPANPFNAILTAMFPMTTFMFLTEGFGAINGTVYAAGNVPLADATVVVEGTNLSYTTGADGTFTFPYVSQGEHQVTVSKYGYIEMTNTVTVVEYQTITTNFTLTPLPQVTVTGRIVGSDQPTIGLADATIILSGYDSYQAITDASGQFTITNVYAYHTYDYLVYVPYYQQNTGTVEIGSIDVNIGDIVVNEMAFPPFHVVATEATDGTNVTISWNIPTPGEDISEGFEGILFPPENWSQIITDNGSPIVAGILPTWCQAGTIALEPPIPPHSGNYQAAMWWDFNHQDEWLITPQFICPADADLTFWSCVCLGSTNGDHYYIKVSTDNGNTWTVLWDASALTGGWNYYETPIVIDLDSYAGQQIKLAWHAEDPPSNEGMWYFWLVDDVSVSNNREILRFPISSLTRVSASDSQSSTPLLAIPDRPANRALANSPVLRESNDVVYNVTRDNRVLTGYKVYRLLSADQSNENLWTLLTPTTINDTTYIDNSWAPLPSGVYRFAIKAVYTNNVLSPAAFSNEIHKGMMGTLTGTVTEFGTDVPIEGATITAGEYSGTSNAQGVYSFSVYQGTYTVTCSKPGYQTATQTGVNIVGLQTTTVNFVLTEITLPPAAVQATEVNQNLVNLTWIAPGTGTNITEGFEGTTFPPTDWSQIITDNGPAVGAGILPTWCQAGTIDITPAVPPHGGIYQAAMWYDWNHQDEWLITPQFICPGGTLTFWSYVYLGSTNGDHYYIKVSTDNGNTWTVLWDASDLTGGWNYYATPIVIDLDSYAGQEIKLAWHADDPPSNDGMWYVWFVDDVTIGNAKETIYFPINTLTRVSANDVADRGLQIVTPQLPTSRARANTSIIQSTRQIVQEPIMRNDRVLNGYKVWRLLQGQETNESAWTLLTTDVITATAYQDYGWGSVPDGMYKWAVKAVYTGGALSNPAFSNALPKLTQIGTIAGTVKNQQNAPIMGATVTCGDVTATTNSSGAYSMLVPAGTHSVTASASGYDSVTQENVIVVTGQTVTVNFILPPSSTNIILEDSFETYENFALTFAPWTCVDVDQSDTYGISGISFPNCYSPMAYIIFVPSATTPPVSTTDVTHTGTKIAASFAATTPPNNDWLITPVLHRPTQITFWARSYVTTYGMERFKVGVSTTGTNPSNFTIISGPNYIEAPAVWTEYTYVIDGQPENAYIGIQCVSNDAFIFLLDDVTVEATPLEDPTVPVLATELQGNYPNPFNPETTIRYSVKETVPVTIEVYNLKGQLVRTLVNEVKTAGNYSVIWNGRDSHNQPVSSGVYFYKMNAGKYSSTKKMIMMK